MRWPRATLSKHGIVGYDRRSRTFHLLVTPRDEEEQQAVLTECERRWREWCHEESPREASRFYAVVEAAGGRCQACGVLAADRALDIDHVVPRSRAVHGVVKLPSGERVPVDDRRNLQALCYRCNRGKRDTGTTDFRPSLDRLAESICFVERRARLLGYSDQELRAKVEALQLAAGAAGDHHQGEV